MGFHKHLYLSSFHLVQVLDHTGELGTYRVFSYYPGGCDDGVLIVAADGYETSVQSAD